MYIYIRVFLLYIYIWISTKQTHTIKHVFKGHCDERTPCDQGTFSQNDVLYFTCYGTSDEGTPLHVVTLSNLRYIGVPLRHVLLYINLHVYLLPTTADSCQP